MYDVSNMAPSQEIYLDNAATTQPHPTVVDAMTHALAAEWGNPSSLHGKGLAAERLVTAARGAIARSLGVTLEEIVFTSGGTEANSLAIQGVAKTAKGRHIITTTIEHSSIQTPIRRLAEQGYEITELPVDRNGRLTAAQVAKTLRPDTALVSVMAVNNEIGTVQPIEEVGRIVRRHRAAGGRALLHVDAVQAWGKVPLRPAAWGVDLMSVSGHKVHGPKGIGALYVRRGVRLAPMLGGGEQEHGVRPGTENVPGIAGLGAAAQWLATDLEGAITRMESLRLRLRELLLTIPDVQMNTPGAGTAPHILNVTVRGVRGETLLHRLEMDGVYISTGSACHSRKPTPSHVLLAIGLTPEEAQSTVRVSLSRFTTAEEIDLAAGALRAAVTELRALVG